MWAQCRSDPTWGAMYKNSYFLGYRPVIRLVGKITFRAFQ